MSLQTRIKWNTSNSLLQSFTHLNLHCLLSAQIFKFILFYLHTATVINHDNQKNNPNLFVLQPSSSTSNSSSNSSHPLNTLMDYFKINLTNLNIKNDRNIIFESSYLSLKPHNYLEVIVIIFKISKESSS